MRFLRMVSSAFGTEDNTNPPIRVFPQVAQMQHRFTIYSHTCLSCLCLLVISSEGAIVFHLRVHLCYHEDVNDPDHSGAAQFSFCGDGSQLPTKEDEAVANLSQFTKKMSPYSHSDLLNVISQWVESRETLESKLTQRQPIIQCSGRVKIIPADLHMV